MQAIKPIISTEPMWLGLGDTLHFLPIVKKISLFLGRKVDVITKYPQAFQNNPFVGAIFDLGKYDMSLQNGNQYFFRPLQHIDRDGDFLFTINNKQFIANKCRFSLLPDEEELEFFPDSDFKIELPDEYVFVNASIRGVDRELGKDNWQRMVEILNDNGIPVVVEGPEEQTHGLKIKNGIDLRGKTSSISDTWHIINRAKAFVSFDTGIYILAGSTKTKIFLINTYFESHWHKPYRNGSVDYKFRLVDGDCGEKCMSNLKYYAKDQGMWQFRVQTCPLNINFRCIPSVEKISTEVVSYWNSNK